MSATDDLRAQLIAQMLGWEADNHLVDAALNTGWGHASDTRASIYREIAKELMPTVREALAEAWDEGYADGGHDEHEFRPGRRATNPWREQP